VRNGSERGNFLITSEWSVTRPELKFCSVSDLIAVLHAVFPIHFPGAASRFSAKKLLSNSETDTW
jgi:hypothetical protein